MNWLKTYLLIALTVIAFLGSIYFMVTLRGDAKREERTDPKKELEKEFNYAYKNMEFISKEIRDAINTKDISIRNCTGYLRDEDKTGKFNTTELIQKPLVTDPNSKIHVIYNACAINTVKHNPIKFIVFTDKILKDLKIDSEEDNQEYLPVLEYTTYSDRTAKDKKVVYPMSYIADFF